jgi:hypothetical protein
MCAGGIEKEKKIPRRDETIFIWNPEVICWTKLGICKRRRLTSAAVREA